MNRGFLKVALGMGNGAGFQLVPQRFGREIGTRTGLVGMTGGLAVLALLGLAGVKRRWRTGRAAKATLGAAGV